MRVVINFILAILGITWLFPVMFTIFGSFKGKMEYNLGNFWDFPKHNLFSENMLTAFKMVDLSNSMLSSFIYAFSGAALSLIIATSAAYAISHLNIKFKMFWFMIIYSGTIFPFQIYLIPVYKEYTQLHLYDTRLGMILFYTSICVPFIMFVLRNFFIGISKEISESARIDGCSKMQVLTRIFIPMAKAPLAIVFLSQFTWCWNDLMFGLTLTKTPGIRSVMAAISLLGKSNIPLLLTGCIVVSIPTIILFLLLQKNFESGFVYTSK
jgi:multiple sugar transport system permease protein